MPSLTVSIEDWIKSNQNHETNKEILKKAHEGTFQSGPGGTL